MRCEMPQLSTVNEKQAQIHMMLLIESFSGYAVCVLLLSLKERAKKAKAKMGLGLGRACSSSAGGEKEFWYLHGVKVCIRGPKKVGAAHLICVHMSVCAHPGLQSRGKNRLLSYGVAGAALEFCRCLPWGLPVCPCILVSHVPITAALGLLSRQPSAKNVFLCISSGVTSRTRAVNVLLYLAQVKPHLKCCAQFWAPQFRKDIEGLEQVQRKGSGAVKGLEHSPVRGYWWSWGCLAQLREEAQETTLVFGTTWKETVGRWRLFSSPSEW